MAERRDLKEGKGHSQTSGAVLQMSVAGSDPEFSTCSQKGLSPWPTAGSLWQVGVGLQRLWLCRRGISARNQGEAALRIAGPVHFLPYVRPLHSSPTIFFSFLHSKYVFQSKNAPGGGKHRIKSKG